MWQRLSDLFASNGFAALGNCMMWQSDLLWLQALSSAVIGAAYCLLPLMVMHFVRRRTDLAQKHKFVAILFALFILTCGLVHLMDVVVLFAPLYGLHALIKVFTAVVAVATVAAVWPLLPQFIRLPGPKDLEAVHTKLQAAYDDLEDIVEERTADLRDIRETFESALRSDNIVIFKQDKDLRYSWISQPIHNPVEAYIGRTDFEILTQAGGGDIIALKQRALATGKTQAAELPYAMVQASGHSREQWYRISIHPSFDSRGDMSGIYGVAVDITSMKEMEREQIRLSGELSASLQRYQLAMQGSRIVMTTQDKELVYTSVSKTMFGLAPDEIVGRTDADSLPPAAANILEPLKRRVLESGTAEHLDMPVKLDGDTLWYDVSLTPLQDTKGTVLGVTTAILDVTERKRWEEHLRLLMREVTHRSKNLLAVIQAMARQTARHTDSVEKFVERFSSRLQALGGAHDLLVKESWHGVNMQELVKSQLGHYADLIGSQILMDGPQVFLAPEAAQNLGMALHEMATNAAKYGALTAPTGSVNIQWEWQDADATTPDMMMKLRWTEAGGPPAKRPERTGFGTHVIERNVTRSLGAKVSLEYAESGFSASMIIPARLLVAQNTPLEAQLPQFKG